MMIAAVTGPTPETDQVILRVAWSPENWRGWVICKTPLERVGFTLSRVALRNQPAPCQPLTITDLPAGHGSCRRGDSCGGDLQGVEGQQARLLPVEGEPGDQTGLGGCAPGQRRPRFHADDPAFGYRFIADELPEKGFAAGENRVQRLCRDHGIWSVFSKRRGLNR
jgi:hypothetical protein